MLKIGLTGGIGSGKTTVANIFKTLGIPIYNADEQAKILMQTNPAIIAQLKEAFGLSIYLFDNKLDRKKLASLVFNCPQKLATLNKIVHPIAIEASKIWMQQQTTKYAIKEAAILFESNSNQGLDYIIAVSAPKSIRIARVVNRDTITVEEVEKRMNNQMEETKRNSLCNFIIDNSGSVLITKQVLKLHDFFLQ
jgi:dephospho-CoA kinase